MNAMIYYPKQSDAQKIASLVMPNGERNYARQLRLLQRSGVGEIIVLIDQKDQSEMEKIAKQGGPALEQMTVMYLDRNTVDEKKLMKLLGEKTPTLVISGNTAFDATLLSGMIGDAQENLFAAYPIQRDKTKMSINFPYILDIEEGSWLLKLGGDTLGHFIGALAAPTEGIDERHRLPLFPMRGHFLCRLDNEKDLESMTPYLRQVDFDAQVIAPIPGDYKKIEQYLKLISAKRPMVVCDSVFDQLFLCQYIRSLSFDFVYFSGFSSNPSYEEVVKGTELFRREQCDAIVSIGGGSAIDTAKNIKLFATMKPDTLYLEGPFAYNTIVHIAVPTTAGTGSESTRFSILYYKGEKKSIAHDSLLPDYAILEPQVLNSLPPYQRKATMLDALSQCIESMWSVKGNAHAKNFARQGIELILNNMDAYLDGQHNDDEMINQAMLVAANVSGKAINITQTTAAHAMSYMISSMYRKAHGHAVALCLPHVWRYLAEHTDSPSPGLAQEDVEGALIEISCAMGHADSASAIACFEEMLARLEMNQISLDNPEDLEVLVQSVNSDRLSNSPVVLDAAAVREIYRKIFRL